MTMMGLNDLEERIDDQSCVTEYIMHSIGVVKKKKKERWARERNEMA